MGTDQKPVNGIAPLRNVILFRELLERVMNRPAHLPGMGAFHGYSGLGKTFAAVYGANCFNAHYVECGVTWTQKKFCQRVLQELGVAQPRGTVADMADKLIELLSMSGRPLIIDEFDHLVSRSAVELVREIHDKSGAAIILIGEEMLEAKLKPFERFHNRVMDWKAAQFSDIEDARHIARLFAPGVSIADALLERVVEESKGQVRRIAVNVERVREKAATKGAKAIDLAGWGDGGFFTGAAAVRDRVSSLRVVK